MNSSSLKIIYEKFNENKMSHIFLIETNDIEQTTENLKDIIATMINKLDGYEKDNIIKMMNNNNLLDYYVIEPDNNSIKKDQIVALFDSCKSIPNYLSNKYYIIKEAEKININSENRILKFIEEPVPGVYGFLICNDSKQLLKTIISRCQRIIDYYPDKIDSENIDEVIIKYINAIETDSSISVNSILNEQYSERLEYVDCFNKIKRIYELLLNNQLDCKELDNLKKLNIKQICGRIALINEIIERLIANCNIKLCLNYFILELRKLDE